MITRWNPVILGHVAIALACRISAAQRTTGPVQPAAPDYSGRATRAFERLGKNLLIIRSRAAPASVAAAGFNQNPSFYYFTGAAEMFGAVLVLDGGSRRSELFLPSRLPEALAFLAGDARGDTVSATRVHVDRVQDWAGFAPYVEDRLRGDSSKVIIVDGGGFEGDFAGLLGTPLDSLATLTNPYRQWQRLIQAHWPKANVRVDSTMLQELRAIKDSAELAVLRRVADASSAAFMAGLRRVAPGRRQREVEAAVVEACVRLGDGPSFWPWAMSGPNAEFPAPFRSFVDTHHLDRVMRAGEIVRLDIGCEVDHYMGDVGRTGPVSRTFTADQAEVVDLLVDAYRAGVAVIRDGIPIAAVIQASVEEVKRRERTLQSPLAKDAAAIITKPHGIPFWQLHGIGLEDAEITPDTLRAGMVVDYEPIFAVAGQGFYMEDMLLVTSDGALMLTRGLPTTAREIQRAMKGAMNTASR